MLAQAATPVVFMLDEFISQGNFYSSRLAFIPAVLNGIWNKSCKSATVTKQYGNVLKWNG